MSEPTRAAESSAEGGLDRLVRERFFPGGRPGVFVDVGAARPDYLSMSASFRALGWRIIAVEPNPAFQKLHRDLGHEILPYACGPRDEDGVDFQVVDSHGESYEGGKVSYEAFSSLAIKEQFKTLSAKIDATTIKVNLRKLDTILAEHAPDVRAVDILAVDVEGWEIEVLQGFSLERFVPRCVVLENIFADPAYREYMADRGYRVWRRIAPNEVYVSPAARLWPGERTLLRIRDVIAQRLRR